MPRAPRITYADRVNYHICKANLDTFNPDDLVEEIVDVMEAHGETVTRRTRGYMRAYLKNLRIQGALSKHPTNGDLVQTSEKFRRAIDRVRASEGELDYSKITRISSLLRVAVGRMKSLTARELRERVIEVIDENVTLRGENAALRDERDVLKKEAEEMQVDLDLSREEGDEAQNENRDLSAENTRLQAHIAELQAISSATPAHESSSTSTDDFQTAPSSPQLGPQQPAGGTLSRTSTEIISPITPVRPSISRNPSGLPTPPTTDARRPLGRALSRTDSHSSSGSHRSFRQNTPGAASVRGATPGSPSRPPHRRSPPLRQLSSQNLDHASPGSTSTSGSGAGSGLARGSQASYSHIRAEFREIDLFMERQRDEQRAYLKRAEEEAVEKARARDDEHAQRVQALKHEHTQRMQALNNELRLKQEELAKVCGQLEELQGQHRVQTKEYEDLYARYGRLLTRVETLTRTLKELADEATKLVDEHPAPVMGGTATAGGASAA